jgi:hypothetical protein
MQQVCRPLSLSTFFAVVADTAAVTTQAQRDLEARTASAEETVSSMKRRLDAASTKLQSQLTAHGALEAETFLLRVRGLHFPVCVSVC